MKKRYTHKSLKAEVELYNDYLKDAQIPIEFVLIRNTTNIVGWRELHRNYTGYLQIASGTPRECADRMRKYYDEVHRIFYTQPLWIYGKVYNLSGSSEFNLTDKGKHYEILQNLCEPETLFIDYHIGGGLFKYRFMNDKFDFETFLHDCAVWMAKNTNRRLSFNESMSHLFAYQESTFGNRYPFTEIELLRLENKVWFERIIS